METQEDSLDLNSLKQFALGFVDEPSRLSANCLTPSDRQTGVTSDKSHASGENGRPSSLRSSLAIATDTIGVTIVPTLPPSARNDATKMTEGVHSQTTTWNVVPRVQSQQMSHPSTQSGDTQPISQSVYDSILRKSDTTGAETRGFHDFDVEYTEVGITQKTLNEGDTGHLDLLAEFDDTGHIRQNDSDAENGDNDPDPDEIEDSSPTHYEPFPESQRFLNRTPTVRNTASTENRDTTTTPSLSRNPFPDENKSPSTVMALSQLFNATQAPSSSVARVPRPELSSDMPSPNIPIQRRFAAAAMSSPLQMISSVARPQYVEPQTSYVSLKESQAARERLVQPATSEDQDKASDDGFEKEDSILQRWVRQKLTEDELGRQFSTITAPARADTHRQMARAASLSPTLGREPPNLGQKVHTRSFQGQGTRRSTVTANGNGNDSEEETEQEDETHVPNTQGSQRLQSSGEEDKENFDSGPIQGLYTAARAHDALSQVLDMEERTSTRGAAFVDVPSSPNVDPVPKKPPETGGDTENEARIISSHPDPISENQPGGDVRMSNAVSQDMGTIVPGQREDVSPSPSPKSAIRSSPPLRPLNMDLEDEGAIQDYETNVGIEPSPSQAAPWRDASGNAGQPNDNAIHETPAPTTNLNPPMDDDNKHSPFSSRIYETPAQTAQPSEYRQKTIPETSPTAQYTLFQSTHRGSLSNHDDHTSPNNGEVDLPPIPRRSATAHRVRLHPSDITKRNMSDPISAILSSPSGRQRRSMTEIATDLSPRPVLPDVSIDELGFMTAEDKEFQTLLAESENYPAKKRRTNDGRSIRASARSRRPIPSKLFATAVADSKVDAHHKIEQKQSDKHEHSMPQQMSQRNSETQGTAEAEQDKTDRDESKKRTGQQVAYAVVIPTPNNSSPPEAKGPRRDSPDPLQPDEGVATGSTQTPKKPTGQPVAPNRVLAFFNGRPQGYFPATCVGISRGAGRFRYLIRFEDSDTPDEIESNNLKRLEVRMKDLVKVDHPNIPRGPFVVMGFADKLEPTALGEKGETAPMTDINGYKSLIVKRRQRQNSPRGQDSGSITVPISNIYFDKALWSKIGARPFTYVPGESVPNPDIRMSLSRGRTPAPLTSRTSRAASEIDGLFSNMAFAVSGKDKDELSQIETLITRNGGRILDEGFDQLFELPFLTSPDSTGDNTASAGKVSCHGTELKLNRKAAQTGFVCLITDECSRRYKYLQALALNLPCLAGRWVRDCVSKKKLVDWEVYLLAAGASSLLDDAFRSRILAPNPPATAHLSATVAARPKLLAGQSVLLIMNSGKVAKQRAPYASLIYVLGTERVSHVQDLETAMDTLEDHKSHSPERGWDWIYVGNEDAAETARESLMELAQSSLSKSATVRKRGRPKKRRRAEPAAGVSTGDIVINDRKVKILDNEFLCQSLILGRLLE